MKKLVLLFLILVFAQLLTFGQSKFFPANDSHIRYCGRIDLDKSAEPVLIGSASFVEFAFTGDGCSVLLKNLNPKSQYSFVSIEIDGEYYGRTKLSVDSMVTYPFEAKNKTGKHILRIYKATEAQNGNLSFGGVNCKNLESLPSLATRKIEFIGNSITCGMGIDWKEIACHTGQWYDQHNAYFAYGPLSAKALNAQFMLSSVSGIGIYRNYNSLHPVMPEVYENKYLNTNTSKKWNFSTYTPDLVSICLGTNDFSEGDGRVRRAAFDPDTYISEYIKFIQVIYSHYPNTQICLLTSPMINGSQAKTFEKCLAQVKEHFDKAEPKRKPIALYYFNGLTPHGCDYHPDKEDHQKMVELLVPFYKKVMGW